MYKNLSNGLSLADKQQIGAKLLNHSNKITTAFVVILINEDEIELNDGRYSFIINILLFVIDVSHGAVAQWRMRVTTSITTTGCGLDRSK